MTPFSPARWAASGPVGQSMGSLELWEASEPENKARQCLSLRLFPLTEIYIYHRCCVLVCVALEKTKTSHLREISILSPFYCILGDVVPKYYCRVGGVHNPNSLFVNSSRVTNAVTFPSEPFPVQTSRITVMRPRSRFYKWNKVHLLPDLNMGVLKSSGSCTGLCALHV